MFFVYRSSLIAPYFIGRAWYYPKVLYTLYDITYYSYLSKRSKQAGYFRGDSQDKDVHSSDEIRLWADAILGPSYTSLSELAKKSYNMFHTPIDDTDHAIGRLGENPAVLISGQSNDWAGVKEVPSVTEEKYYASTSEKWSFVSSENFYSKEFNPFGSTHNSSIFEVYSWYLLGEAMFLLWFFPSCRILNAPLIPLRGIRRVIR